MTIVPTGALAGPVSLKTANPGAAPSPTAPQDTVSEGRGVGDLLKNIAITTTVIGAPALLGAGLGWTGAIGGVAASGLLVRLGVHNSSDRGILMPLALLTSGISGVAGCFFGWPGAAVATAAGIAYGIVTR